MRHKCELCKKSHSILNNLTAERPSLQHHLQHSHLQHPHLQHPHQHKQYKQSKNTKLPKLLNQYIESSPIGNSLISWMTDELTVKSFPHNINFQYCFINGNNLHISGPYIHFKKQSSYKIELIGDIFSYSEAIISIHFNNSSKNKTSIPPLTHFNLPYPTNNIIHLYGISTILNFDPNSTLSISLSIDYKHEFIILSKNIKLLLHEI